MQYVCSCVNFRETLIYTFLLLFLFFRKHKQNKKRNIIREKIKWQMIFLSTTIFNVGYHDSNHDRKERKRHIQRRIFFTRGSVRPLKISSFYTDQEIFLSKEFFHVFSHINTNNCRHLNSKPYQRRQPENQSTMPSLPNREGARGNPPDNGTQACG